MALLERRDARLVLLGDGAERAPLARLAGSLGLANRVEFTGWLDPISLAGRLRRCLVTVISVASKSSIAFPNKIGDYAAAGRAIVSGVGGELEKLLRAYDAGVCYRAGDPADLARQLDALLGDQERARVMGRHARRLCSEQLDRAQTYPRLVALLEELAGD
jgi:glycosyltransferase involved in cell wall biosynthesis